MEPFNFTVPYPEPYVPRSLTFEVPGRICGRTGSELATARRGCGAASRSAELAARDVEAVAVCLLWSIVNPAHELRVGELLERDPAGRALHAVAPAEPDVARIPPRLLGLHRRFAEADDGGLSCRA